MSAHELTSARLATPGTISAVVSQADGAAMRVLSALMNASGARLQEWTLSSRAGLCFVPAGAPLLEHRSAAANVRHLCCLGGRADLADQAITYALRLADLPDQRLHTRASRLDGLERLAVWLAVHRLRQTHTIVLDDPTRGLTQRSVDHVTRLVREAAALPSAVVVTTPDTTFAATLSDTVITLGHA